MNGWHTKSEVECGEFMNKHTMESLSVCPLDCLSVATVGYARDLDCCHMSLCICLCFSRNSCSAAPVNGVSHQHGDGHWSDTSGHLNKERRVEYEDWINSSEAEK